MSKHTDAPIRRDQRSAEEHVDKHPHVHAFTHALATAGQVYADTIADLVTSHHPPEWQHALDEYDRTHPKAGSDRPSDPPSKQSAPGSRGPKDAR